VGRTPPQGIALHGLADSGRSLAFAFTTMTFNENARLDPSQVEDRRGSRGGFGGFGGGGGGRGPVIAGGGGISILLLVASLLLGVNPFDMGGAGTSTGLSPSSSVTWPEQVGANQLETAQECQTGADANRRADCRVVGFVNSIQDYWRGEFQRRNLQYVPAKTVLFSGATQAGCGMASEAMGPFYCPEDQRIYLDLSFFTDLQGKYGASGGPFAQAYVVAHEYGHHLQNVLNLLPEGASQDRGAQGAAVRVELMADCLAGAWAKGAQQTKDAEGNAIISDLTQDDVKRAIDAAQAVGDDRIQKRSSGRVDTDSFTHGTAAQRVRWFNQGLSKGSIKACDTFATDDL
jgi:predicted metalloprotease